MQDSRPLDSYLQIRRSFYFLLFFSTVIKVIHIFFAKVLAFFPLWTLREILLFGSRSGCHEHATNATYPHNSSDLSWPKNLL